MRPTARARWLWLVLALLACGGARDGAAEGSAAVDLGGEPDSRYRIAGRLVAGSSDAAPSLRVRVEPLGDWHIALEAPARLELVSSERVRFPRDRLDRDDAVAVDEEALEFATELSIEPGGPAEARGHLKFGICEGAESVCSIVRRDLEIALPLAGNTER